jgi:hypothetical protein
MICEKRVAWSLLWTCTWRRKVRSSARPWNPSFVDKAWVRVASVVVVSSVRGVGSSSLRVWARVVSRGEEEAAEEERVRVLLGVGVAATAVVEGESVAAVAVVLVLVVLAVGVVTTCASIFFIDLAALLAAEEGGKGCMHTTKRAGAMRADGGG